MSNYFYNITHSTNNRLCYATEDTSFAGYQKEVCLSCGRDIYTMKYAEEKYRFLLAGGKSFPDWLQYCGAGEFPIIFSEYAVNVLQKECITGFSVKCEASLFINKKTHIEKITDCPTYFILDISGRIDYDYTSMFLKRKRNCTHCNQFSLNRERLYPVYLNESSWNGFDLCTLITFPRQQYCTERFVQIISKYKLSGFEFNQTQKAKQIERQGTVCVNPNEKLR